MGLLFSPCSPGGGAMGVVSTRNRVRPIGHYYSGHYLLIPPPPPPPPSRPDIKWRGLVEAMSGLLGAHLNAIDSTSSFLPRLSFRPQGAILGQYIPCSIPLIAPSKHIFYTCIIHFRWKHGKCVIIVTLCCVATGDGMYRELYTLDKVTPMWLSGLCVCVCVISL